MEDINIAYNMAGPNNTAAILINKGTGYPRVSINTQLSQTDAFRIKVYSSSSAMTFESTDVVTLYLYGPDPSTAVTTYHPIDGRFLPIDGTTITLNSNNQLQAATSTPDGFDFIVLDNSSSSGTLTAADLAKIADHPQRCVIVKYGSSAQYVQSYQLREIAYTDSTQTTVSTYTFGYIQTNGNKEVRDRKVVVTASTGAWTYTQVSANIPTTRYLQSIQLYRNDPDNQIQYSLSSSYIVGTSINYLSTSTTKNNLCRYLAENYSAGSGGSTAIANAAAASGKLKYQGYEFNITGISAYRASSSSATLYIIYYDSEFSNALASLAIDYTDIGDGYARGVAEF